MDRLFEQEENRSNRAYMMNLVGKGRFRPYFFGRRFYYRQKPAPVALSRVDQLPKHYEKKDFWSNNPRLFFATAYGYPGIKGAYFEDMPYVDVHLLNHLTVVEVRPDDGSMRQAVLQTFRRLSLKVKRAAGNYKLMEILFELERIEQNPEGMAFALKKIKSFNHKGTLTKMIAAFEETLKGMPPKQE
jgi:hypothetical protein